MLSQSVIWMNTKNNRMEKVVRRSFVICWLVSLNFMPNSNSIVMLLISILAIRWNHQCKTTMKSIWSECFQIDCLIAFGHFLIKSLLFQLFFIFHRIKHALNIRPKNWTPFALSIQDILNFERNVCRLIPLKDVEQFQICCNESAQILKSFGTKFQHYWFYFGSFVYFYTFIYSFSHSLW